MNILKSLIGAFSAPGGRVFTVGDVPTRHQPGLFSENQGLIHGILNRARENKLAVNKIVFFGIRIEPYGHRYNPDRSPEDKAYDDFAFFFFKNDFKDDDNKLKKRILGSNGHSLVLAVTKEEYRIIRRDSDNFFRKVDSFRNGNIQIMVPFASITELSFINKERPRRR